MAGDLAEIIRAEMNVFTLARKAEVVAVLWATRRRALLKNLLEDEAALRAPQVLHNASVLLDLPRRVRAAEKRLVVMEAQGSKPSKLRTARSTLAELRDAAQHVPSTFSASKTFLAVLRKQLTLLPAERLEFDLLYARLCTACPSAHQCPFWLWHAHAATRKKTHTRRLSTCSFFEDGPWKGLCDIAHVKPSTWQLEHFQEMCFGAPPTADTLLADTKTMSVATLPALLHRHPRLAEAYSFVRGRLPPRTLDAAAKLALVRAMPLADVIWHYEELHTPTAAEVLGTA